jgi:hypothetical protein
MAVAALAATAAAFGAFKGAKRFELGSPTDERWSGPLRGHTHLPNFGFQAQLENFTHPPATTVLLRGTFTGTLVQNGDDW